MRHYRFLFGIGILLATVLVACGKPTSKMQGPADTEVGGGSTPGGNYGSDVKDAIKSIPGMGKVDQDALAKVNEKAKKVAPSSTPDPFSDEIKALLAKLSQAEKQDQDTTPMRMTLMGKMLFECADVVKGYTPQPGETYLGKWGHRCTNTNINSAWNLEAAYPAKDSAGVPKGKPNYSYKGVVFGDVNGTPVGGAGTGSFSAESSGAGRSEGTWVAYAAGKAYPWTWTCNLKDTPSAATGNCITVTQAQYCNAAPGALLQSTNPIPEKYDEAMKKLGACYRRAILLVSPILWNYIAKLPTHSQNLLYKALLLQ